MSLDPTDWNAVRALGRQMVDDMVDYLETVRDRPVWQTVPAEVKGRLEEAVPRAGESLEAVYEAFRRDVLPYPTGNIHPRFWGWVMGTGSATGMLAEMLAAGMNPHLAGYDQSAALVERQVLGWLKALMGYPEEASGLLVSGGTAANLNALIAARVAKAGFDVRQDGLAAGPPLTVYGSAETHSWILKACETMGLGRQAFRAIPVDGQYRLDLAAWSDEPELVAGQASADSLAFDLHKWGYMPYEVGVVLTRDGQAQISAFQPPQVGGPAYLQSARGGASADTTYFADRGLQLSRGFRALKVWMSMKEQGLDRIGAAIQRNIDQARYLERLIGADPDLELLAPVGMNVVCFRYAPAGADPATLNRLNQDILIALQSQGIAVPSQTVLQGRFAIRVCITNHRSEDADFDMLVTAVKQIAAEVGPVEV